MVLDRMRGWYDRLVAKVSSESSSQVLLQVVVLNAMKPRRLSARVLLQTSIWTVIIIVTAFVAIYTLLLTYMDRHMAMSARLPSLAIPGDNTHNGIYTHNSHKLKLHSKFSGIPSFGGEDDSDALRMTKDRNSHRKMLWNSSKFYDSFTIRPQCQKKTALFSIIITSTPDHFDQRNEIRKTWCNPTTCEHPSGSWQCFFLIGQTSVWDVDAAVDKEADTFKDILRGSYVDSYQNLTLKVVHGFNWISAECSTPYILKTDDDCFVNVVQLYSFLRLPTTEDRGIYAGNVYKKQDRLQVIRNKGNKWAVSREDYFPDYYPPYASGTGYVMSQDVANAFVVESAYIKPFPNEDAYVGVVIDSLGVKPVYSSRFTLFNAGLRLCNYLYVFVSHGVKPLHQKANFEKMLRAVRECKRQHPEEAGNWS